VQKLVLPLDPSIPDEANSVKLGEGKGLATKERKDRKENTANGHEKHLNRRRTQIYADLVQRLGRDVADSRSASVLAPLFETYAI
jgi:hypothetical protein